MRPVYNPSTRRKWRFNCYDFDGNSVYLDASGNEAESDLSWIGTSYEAAIEAKRRADIFEDKNKIDCKSVVYESLGVVTETPERTSANPSSAS